MKATLLIILLGSWAWGQTGRHAQCFDGHADQVVCTGKMLEHCKLPNTTSGPWSCAVETPDGKVYVRYEPETKLNPEPAIPQPGALDSHAETLCTVKISVGEHKDVSVYIPCISKPDLTEMVSILFDRGDEAAKKKFEDVLSQSGELTLTVTTRRP